MVAPVFGHRLEMLKRYDEASSEDRSGSHPAMRLTEPQIGNLRYSNFQRRNSIPAASPAPAWYSLFLR